MSHASEAPMKPPSPDQPDWMDEYAGFRNLQIICWADKHTRPEGHDVSDVLVAEQIPDSSAILNWLSESSQQLEPGGELWVRLRGDYEACRAGKQRWMWLVDLAGREGFDYLDQVTPAAGAQYLRFKKYDAWHPRWRLQSPTSSHREACFKLFEKAFDKAINPDLWDWKYSEGRGRATLAMREGQIIAHYGCVTRRILLRGRETKALQICDVMVDPRERAVMTRSGAFFQVAKAAQEAFIGFGPEHELGYGFPNERHMQLAEKMGLYDDVGQMVELEWKTNTTKTRAWTTVSECVDSNDVSEEEINRLWDKMSRKLREQVLVIRDASYWNYRYGNNPEHEYVIQTVRSRLTRRLIGISVLSKEQNECKLMDVLGDPAHFRLLIEHARQQAASWGLTSLKAWTTKNSADWLRNNEEHCKTIDIKIPLNIHARIHPTSAIKDRWFLMMGDTDFL